MPTVQMRNTWLAGKYQQSCPTSQPRGCRKLPIWPLETSTNPDLAFISIDSDSRLPDRHVLEKFPRSQYQLSLVTSPSFALCHSISLTNKLARTLPPPDSPDMHQACRCFCNAISIAAKKCIPRGRQNNRIPCWDAECENLYQTFLIYPEG